MPKRPGRHSGHHAHAGHDAHPHRRKRNAPPLWTSVLLGVFAVVIVLVIVFTIAHFVSY